MHIYLAHTRVRFVRVTSNHRNVQMRSLYRYSKPVVISALGVMLLAASAVMTAGDSWAQSGPGGGGGGNSGRGSGNIDQTTRQTADTSGRGSGGGSSTSGSSGSGNSGGGEGDREGYDRSGSGSSGSGSGGGNSGGVAEANSSGRSGRGPNDALDRF